MATLKCPRCASARVQRNFGDAPFLLRAVGINDLLCNNCNAEFRGFAPPGMIRRSRRHKIELGAGAHPQEPPRAPPYAPRVAVLPEARFTDAELRGGHGGGGHRARLLLHIAPRTLTLDATIVRYEQLDEDDALTGWLIAARITRLAGDERERYIHFLKTFGV